MKTKGKKILVISHNPLSRVNNNGKTLASIFEGVPLKNIYQIYLNMDVPDYSEECHYLQLNEKQIICSIASGKNLCCQEISPMPEKVSSATIRIGSFGTNTKRLLRECIWKFDFWKTRLKDWLADKHFDVVFFMAGDGLFAYDVYRFVMQNVHAKGCMFFTDDYIIGKTSYSLAYLLRQRMLKRKIRKTLSITKEVYVISDEMKEAYFKLLGVNSYVIRNFSVEKKNSNEKQLNFLSDGLTMVYAGGLHYDRWQVLSAIADALKTINTSNSAKCQLKIYSSQNISDNIIEKLNVDSVSEFCGSASALQIADIYSSADILLHVESFNKRAIASTKYSFSTKIPEYLSAGKCILAVGPSEVASIRYLTSFSCVISDGTKLISALTKLINDNEYRTQIASNSEEQYEKDFSKKKQKESLKLILSI